MFIFVTMVNFALLKSAVGYAGLPSAVAVPPDDLAWISAAMMLMFLSRPGSKQPARETAAVGGGGTG